MHGGAVLYASIMNSSADLRHYGNLLAWNGNCITLLYKIRVLPKPDLSVNLIRLRRFDQ